MMDDITSMAYAAGWGTVRRMPGPVARATFRGIADQAWLRHGRSVQQLERNLRDLQAGQRPVFIGLLGSPELEGPLTARAMLGRDLKLSVDESVIALNTVSVPGTDLDRLILAIQRIVLGHLF